MNTMVASIAHVRKPIAECLRAYAGEKRAELARINPLGPDVAERLLASSLQGKMLRGCLVHLGWSIAAGHAASDEPIQPVVIAAAAMELFQSGLLVHDDIMDQDRTRRGADSLWCQYEGVASADGQTEPSRVGTSLAICAGDVAYFLAFELLTRMKSEPWIVKTALGACAAELTRVGVAQMQDVSWGASRRDVDERDILRMYTYKTGRYTFSLPLLVGALIGGAAAPLDDELASLGESIGMLFQIRDDELGLFGSAEETGKPVGSDVREGKKTLFASRLLAAASPEERRRLDGIFGNSSCTAEDIVYVRGLLRDKGIREKVDTIAAELAAETRSRIRMLHTRREPDREALRELLEFAVERRQ